MSVPVGNSTEIADWTSGGIICEALVDSDGYTRVDPAVFASKIEEMLGNKYQMCNLGKNGQIAVTKRFNWANLVIEYETMFYDVINNSKYVKLSQKNEVY